MKIAMIYLTILASTTNYSLLNNSIEKVMLDASSRNVIIRERSSNITIKIFNNNALNQEDVNELNRLAKIYRYAKFNNSHIGLCIDVCSLDNNLNNSYISHSPENLKFFKVSFFDDSIKTEIIHAYDKEGKLIFSTDSIQKLFMLINRQLSRV